MSKAFLKIYVVYYIYEPSSIAISVRVNGTKLGWVIVILHTAHQLLHVHKKKRIYIYIVCVAYYKYRLLLLTLREACVLRK